MHGHQAENGNDVGIPHIANKGVEPIATWPEDMSRVNEVTDGDISDDDKDDDDATLAQRVESLAKQMKWTIECLTTKKIMKAIIVHVLLQQELQKLHRQ